MKCFVMMPFGNSNIDAQQARKLDSIYSQWIKPTVESITIPEKQSEKIICHRADKTFKPGEIITHVIENIMSAEIAIADLSGKSPNVFYELGVRHAVGNNCILISDNLEDVPFDLRPLRTIIYEYEPESMLRLKSSLEQAILEILKDPNTVDNPIRRYIYQRELDKSVKEKSSPESDLVKKVLFELGSLRKDFMEQSNEVRGIMKLITSAPKDDVVSKLVSNTNLEAFEGVWEDIISGSRFYVRVVDGEIFAPYSYGPSLGYKKSTNAYLYNCKVIDSTLFGRFKWFDAPISGYMFLKIETEKQINGGWWYAEDLPSDVVKDISKISGNLPKMNRLSLERISSSIEFPSYVEKYLKEDRLKNL